MMRWFVVAIAVILCISPLFPCAHAVDLSRANGQLYIELEYSGRALSGIDVSICRVADVTETGGQAAYTLTGVFAPGNTLNADGVMTAQENSVLAKTLDARATANNIARTVVTTSATGEALFSGLTSGMYLVAQANAANAAYLMAPVLVPVPYYNDKGWSFVVTAYPKTEPVKDPPTTSSVSVQKIVAGDRPTENGSFQFTLTARDNAPMPSGSSNGIKTVTLRGEGEISFGDITYTQPGTYVYTVAELAVGEKGYTYDNSVYTLTVVITGAYGTMTVQSKRLEKDGVLYDKAVFTNRYRQEEPGTDKVVISGSKTWQHGANKPENYPQSIMINIIGNNQIVLQWVVTEAEHWSWSFILDKYDANGREIVYTVDEFAVPNYVKRIDGYNVINTYSPGAPGEPTPTPGPGVPGTPKPGGDEDIDKPKTPTSPPSTGDDSNLWLWVYLLAASTFTLGLVARGSRRKHRIK